MGFLLQLRLLLWKNFTLRKRQPIRVVVELVWPLVLFLILVAVRTRPDIKQPRSSCYYNPRAMPSAGALTFLSSYVCNINNECKQTPTSAQDSPGFINPLNDTLIGLVLNDIETVLASNVDTTELINLGRDLELIDEFLQSIQNRTVSLASLGIRLSDVLVNRQDLVDIVTNQSIALTPEALDTLLNSSLNFQQILNTLNSTNRTEIDDLIAVAMDFISLGSSTAQDVVVADILNITCSDQILLQYFTFSDPAAARDLQAQVCNLTIDQATLLLEDIYRNINVSEVVREVEAIVEDVTGETPEFVSRWPMYLGIFRDLQGLSSLNFLAQDLATAASDLSPAQMNMSNLDPVALASRLVCGEGRNIFGLGALTGDDNSDDSRNDEGTITNPDGTEIDQDDESEEANKEYREALENNLADGMSQRCAELFATFDSQQLTRVLWDQLKPIVLGVINYTPDNEATRAIIKQASRTFDSIASLLNLAVDVESVLPAVERFLENDIEPIREFVSSPACKNAIYSVKRILENPTLQSFIPAFELQLVESFLVAQGVDESTCDTVADFIARDGLDGTYDWRDALNNTYNLLRSAQPYFGCFNLNKFIGYSDMHSWTMANLKHIDNKTLWAAIVFDNIDQQATDVPSLVKYTIRMDTDRVDSTKKIKDKYWRPGPRSYFSAMKYWIYGFIYIQDMIDHAIIRHQTNVTQEPGVYTHQFPYPCYVWDRFVFAISRSLPLFMIISWIYTVAMIIKGIVYEKEQRLKEVMKIMGLGNGVHWLAWFINSFIMMIITVLLFCIICKLGMVLEYSDPSVVFVFMMAFTMSTISMCFLISVFFSKANLAAVCGGFIYFVTYLPYTQLVQWEDEITTTQKILASLSSNIAMGYGFSYFAQYEEQAIGAKWSNIGSSPVPDDTFSLETCISMMFLDAIIYFLITWYIEAVFPGQYGIPRKWYFPIQKSYWFGDSLSSKDRTMTDAEIAIDEIRNNSEDFEADPTGRTVGVAVRNLTKVYNKGDKVAVDGLTINFYEGQITSFLGHNGAGKTTTMSILTGLFPPTSGTAFVYGRDICTDIDHIRSGLGMCPQHNVLFDLLTVEEHIWFYARLKGRSEEAVKKEINQMIKDVGLPDKRKEVSTNLSGGMKRKLSVAVAFVGGSRTVILDEPTAGVDPYARRAIWELLLKFRRGRTIILSTHHMDEADVLGDRIAIISQGKLCTVGSSLFLKNRFGSGYYLTLVRENGTSSFAEHDDRSFSGISNSSRPSTATSVRTIVDVKAAVGGEGDDEGYDEKNSEDSNSNDDVPVPLKPPRGASNMIPGFNLSRLTAFVQGFVPGAVLVEDNSMEVCFRLPEDTDHAQKFQRLFAALEFSHKDMGISSYGISDTNLEEVFLKVASENSTSEEGDENLRSQLEVLSENGKYPRPVSRLSRRKKMKTSLFAMTYRNRVNSSVERLVEDMDDTESVTSEATDVSAPAADINFSGAGQVQITGWLLIMRQMVALFLKRLHHVRRSKKGFVSEILLPAGFVCLAMIFALILPPFEEEPPLELQPWMYEPITGDSALTVFYSNDNPSNTMAESLERSLLHTPYFGNRCMNSSLHTIGGKECLPPITGPLAGWTPRPTLNYAAYPDCSCDTKFQRCPYGAAGPEPSKKKIRTNDLLNNVTNHRLEDWLMKSMEGYMKRRFGGFSFGEENPLGRLNASQLSAAMDRLVRAANNNQSIFSGSEQLWTDLEAALKFAFVQDNVKVWFNNKGWAAAVSYMNAMNNLILRSLLPSEKDPHNYGIVTVNHPLNLTKAQLNEETLVNNAVDLAVAICVIFAMSFVPASFVLFLIEERVSNSKHLQFVSGINPTVYWVSTWMWDMLNYSIPAMLCIIIFLAFDAESYVSAKSFPCLVALLFLYGWSIVPMMYPFSRLFDVPSSAFVALSCMNVFLGTVSTLATFILEVLAQDDEELESINNTLKQVFLILPHYCLGRGLLDMATAHVRAEILGRFGEDVNYDLFAWNMVGRNIFAMVMMGVCYNILNLLIEYKFFLSWMWLSRAPKTKTGREDVDVAREKQRVLNGGARDDVLRLEGLCKVYWRPGRKGKMTAVDHIYVGVPKGQCFGLLGVNGAGKSTTFKMLTGDVSVTQGDAFINNYSICSDMVQVRKFMGYCPQFDALDPLLTGREHLEFYARIRGISPSHVKSVADWAIRKLGLLRHADKIASSYSGGNKRKLSTAIALIGNPPIIFLDEPTTGMDPGARRFLWNCINSIVKAGRSVILTSHSMEECEALCNRLAIMVNGNFQCLGSIQHLKNRFGNGYTIILRVSGHNPDLRPVMEFITDTFSSARLREKHHNMLQYQLGSDNLSLSKLFEAMEEAKLKFNVEDYSVSQTTLDQVFINFAKKQTDLLDEELEESANLGVDTVNGDEEDDDFDEDNLSYLNQDTVSTGRPSEVDDTSLAGSTAELVRPSSARSSLSRNGNLAHRASAEPEDMANGVQDSNKNISVRF
ncbi:ATP-binding cassette sub-family a member 1 [Plakobranchus ocellatus]|uniref:ATP-binding cassette sub-family a member 1 n=2 Tax=Plakobranchus ocellatus TaxID=259542 RepID=A0AAV3ZQD1_9GAST|nr:ATP-binding cassette sub-family a member 1 [Plakobranchus ocellatus]